MLKKLTIEILLYDLYFLFVMNQFSETTPWNIKELVQFDNGPEFDNLLKDIESKTKELESFRSRLSPNVSENDFLNFIKTKNELSIIISKLSAFSNLRFYEDTSNQEARAFMARIDELLSDVSNRIMFFGLWWKDLDDQNFSRLLKVTGDDKYYFESARRFKPYTLSEKEEQVINLKDVNGTNALINIFTIITNKFRFSITVDGVRKKISSEELLVYIRSPKPEIREAAYKALWKVYKNYNDELGEIYKSIILDYKNECLKLRKYKSPISVRNIGNDIDDKAIESLLSACQKNVKLFQDYFLIKAKLLNIPKMSRYHLYAPLKESDKTYSYSESVDLVLDSFDDFSKDFGLLARRLFDQKHIDAALRLNKKKGAFCYSVTPDITPYVLLNFTGKARDVATIAHEFGHAIHSMLASKHSILSFHAPIPLAETASVFAELLLSEKLIKDEKDIEVKKDLLASKIDDIYATVIRQAYFVIFEKKAHEAIANGATINDINKLYLSLLKEQFGSQINVPKSFQYEWNYIPHIYETPFYCYGYAFGNLLVLALYEKYKEQGASFIPKYIELLSSGGSKPPQEILSKLDIDINSEDFWNSGFKIVEKMINELKELVK